MSVQWGLLEFDGGHREEAFLAIVPSCLEQWGPDDSSCWKTEDLLIGAHSFHVTREDLRQTQPLLHKPTGNVLTLDGRLDNRAELLLELGLNKTCQQKIRRGAWNPANLCDPNLVYLRDRGEVLLDCPLRHAEWLVPADEDPTDLEIVAAAFAKWKTGCFAKLRGDWAITIWEDATSIVHLSRDPFGPRHLFYLKNDSYICWSSRYEALMQLAKSDAFDISLTKDFVYTASDVLALPSIDAAPYFEMGTVPPAHIVSVDQAGDLRVERYLTPPAISPDESITFVEAKNIFRHLLERSLICRMRTIFPVTFELSGGCDSSTLVCLADSLYRQGKVAAEWSTVTRWPYKNDESHDLRYTEIVENSIGRRGRRVCTFSVSDQDEEVAASVKERSAYDAASNALLEHSPSLAMRSLWSYRAEYTDIITDHGGRVLLCGIGGDELAGGVQPAGASLSDAWTDHSFPDFVKQLTNWARYKNDTVWRLLFQVALDNLPMGLAAILDNPTRRKAKVFRSRFPQISTWKLAMIRFAFSGSTAPLRSRRYQGRSVWPLSPELSHKQRLCHIGSWRRAFPFISREWVEALAVLPPEYLQTSFQRRRLHRAAVNDVVPEPVLWRKTKDVGAYTARIDRKSGSGRLLKNLEEHAELLQLLQRTDQLVVTESKPVAAEPKPVMAKASKNKDKHPPESLLLEELCFQPTPQVRFVSDRSGGTLLDISRGKRVVLNPTGAFIWERIIAEKVLGQISNELADRFGITHNLALTDTRTFVSGLLKNEMLTATSNSLLHHASSDAGAIQ